MPAPEPGESWGILGGVFDPVHCGHLALATDVQATRRLDGVLFVPTFEPPHRSAPPAAEYADRIEMLKLAVQDQTGFEISRIEETTSRPSYTLETVRALKTAHPGVEFSFIVGADNLGQLKTWREWEKILDEVRLLVGCRPGATVKELSALPAGRIDIVETSLVDLSSTYVRSRVKQGVPFDELAKMVPQAVATYILQRELYR
jgi:nicotinate-nucleotide adenylyltransferase